MTAIKCPVCGKFLRNVMATVSGIDNEIIEVAGFCKTHGMVEPTNWEYWDFFPEESNP